MAKAATEKKANGGISVLGILILTVIGVASGAFFGMQVPGLVSPSPEKPHAAGPVDPENAPPPNAVVKPLPPITTNLARPTSTWVRIESSIVINTDLGPDANVITAQMTEDIVAYLRTLTIDQVEGPSGFQHLREDLNDRVRVRSQGKVSEVIIQSLIIE
jgi:flagellar protein FliL